MFCTREQPITDSSKLNQTFQAMQPPLFSRERLYAIRIFQPPILLI